MTKMIPENIMKIFEDRATSKVIATISGNGDVHVVPMGQIFAIDPHTIAIGKVSLVETHQNLLDAKARGKSATVLVTRGMESYQFRCNVKEFVTSGPIFERISGPWDAMVKNMPSPDGKPFLPGVSGVWLLEPKEIINQGVGPDGRGKRL